MKQYFPQGSNTPYVPQGDDVRPMIQFPKPVFEQGGPVDTPTEGEGGIYGAPDSMFNTPESLAAALYPQHNTAYGGGGKVREVRGLLDMIRDKLRERPDVFWHGSPSGDLRGGPYGLHVGTLPAAHEALNERIGAPLAGKWDGRRVWGETPMSPKGGPAEASWYSNGDNIPYTVTPDVRPYEIVGDMFNSRSAPLADDDAAYRMIMDKKGGQAKRGYYYSNDAEDVGSISATVPTASHLREIEIPTEFQPYADGGPVHMEVGGILRRASRLGDMVQFPNPVFAEGGEVEMAGGGADKIKEAAGWLRRLSKYNDAPSKHIDDYQWKPMSEVGERLGQIDAIPPHVENFGAFMQEQAQRAANEGLTPRDLLKAFGITRGSIQRSALPTDSIRATGLDIPGSDPTIRPEGAFATWMGTKPGQSWLDKGQSGIVDFDAINDAQQRLAPFGKSGDLAQFLQWGPENLPGREGRLSELVDRARTTGNSAPEEWKDAVGDLFGIKLAKRGFFSAMLGRGDQPVFDARQIDLNVPKGNYAGKYERRGGGEGGDEIMARLAARQNALGIGVPKDLMPFQQYLTHHTTWDKLGNEATTHQDLIDSLRGHAEGGPIEMKKGGKSPAMEVYDLATKAAHKLFGSPDKIVEENLVDRAAAASGRPREEIIDALRQKSAGVKGDTTTERGITSLKPTGPISDATAAFSPSASSLPRNIFNPQDWLGHILVGGMSDRAAAGEHLLGVGGTKLRSPLWLPGGSDYPLHHDDLWASDPKALTSFLNAIKNHPDGKNMPALFTNKLMGYQGADQSHMAMKGAVDLLRDADVSRPDANTFRDYARSLKVTKTDPETDVKTTSFPLERFPGIRSDNLEEYLMTLPMGDRSTLIKAMDKASYNKMGIPNPTALRMAITDPALYATPTGTPGRTIGRIDMDNPINMSPDLQHGSYPAGLRGEFLGGLDRIVRPEHWFPDFFENRAKGLDSKGNVRGPAGATHDNRFTARAFMTSPVTQVLDQRWLDQFMPAFNAAKPGWEEGGTVEDQYHPIWQQGFAGGGQPDKYDNAFDVMYPWLSDASRFEPMSPPPPVDPQAHRMAMIAKARARREDQQWQDDPHSYFDSRTAPTGQYLWDGLKQTMLGAASAIPKQIGDMSELANEFISDKIPYYTRADVDSFMDRNGMAPDFEGSRRARTIGTNMGDTIGAFSKLAAKAPGWFNATRRGGTRGMNTGSGLGIAGTFFGGDEGPQYDDMGLNEAVQQRGRFAHGGSVEDQYHPIWSQNFAEGGSPEHAPDFGDNFDGMPGIGSLMDIAGGLFGGEDVDLHDILGEGGRALGTLIGAYAGMPGVGGSLGEFGGNFASNLIEPDNGEDTGQDAMRIGSGFARGQAMSAFMAGGGPVDDFTEPGMPFFGVGVPEFDVDPLRTNPQVARDADERRRLLGQVQADSQKGLAQQMKAKDGGGGGMGGMGDIMGVAMKMAPQIMSMMASHGGPVGHYADGGSIPAPNGEQPWMYGGGALMARGGYLRGHGGMNG